MSVGVGLPASAAVDRAVDSDVIKAASAGSGRASLVWIALIELVWIAALVYGVFEAEVFVRGLIWP